MVISGENTNKWSHVNSAFMCFVYLFTKKFLTEFIEKFVKKLSKFFLEKLHICVQFYVTMHIFIFLFEVARIVTMKQVLLH